MRGVRIEFPNIGISFHNISSGFEIFGFYIAFYGVIIALGMMMGYFVAVWQAKKTGQKTETYLDFALYAIFISVLGARIYYVIFNWDRYKDNLWEIFNLRGGGLAIYGGVIAAVITALVYCKIKRINFGLLADTACLGLVTGQIIGRWGNFFNCEAFGGYAGNHLLAMKLPWSVARTHMSESSIKIMEQYVVDNSILVHPTFLYESLWNIGVLLFLIWYSKKKRFHGEVFLLYLIGYGLGRVWIEGLRTDQLFLWGTILPVSQVLSALIIVASGVLIVVLRKKSIVIEK